LKVPGAEILAVKCDVAIQSDVERLLTRLSKNSAKWTSWSTTRASPSRWRPSRISI
jgi:hypothetical protein